MGRRVRKFDGPSGRGLRIALRAMLIKSALRDWLYESYSLIRITMMSHLRWLSPLWCLTAPPSRPAGKRVTRFSGRFAPLRIVFPCHRSIGRATKGKRLYGQARRLTSPDLHILCRMCTVDNKALKSSLLIIDSIMPLHRGWQRNWIHRREKRPTNQVPLPPQGDTRTLQDLPSRLQW